MFTTNATTNSTSDTFLVVYFEGINADTSLLPADLDWVVLDKGCRSVAPIGFGLPGPSGIVMYGELSDDGSLNRFQNFGDKPLFGLVFVIPKTMVEVTLWDPQRVEHHISVVSAWLPERQNAIDGFYFDGSVIRPDKGDNWTSGP